MYMYDRYCFAFNCILALEGFLTNMSQQNFHDPSAGAVKVSETKLTTIQPCIFKKIDVKSMIFFKCVAWSL